MSTKKPPGRTGKQHQVPRLLEFVYHLPWKSRGFAIVPTFYGCWILWRGEAARRKDFSSFGHPPWRESTPSCQPKNPRVGPGNNTRCLDCSNSSTICPESQEGLPSYPPFTDVEFFDGARLLVIKISHRSDTHREGKVLLRVNQKTPGSDRETTPGVSTVRIRLPFTLKIKTAVFERFRERSDVDQRSTYGTKRHIARSRALIMIGSDLLTVDLWSELKYIFSAKSRQTFGCLRLAFPTKQQLRSSRNLDQPIVPMNRIRRSPFRFSKEGSTRHPSRPPGGMTWN